MSDRELSANQAGSASCWVHSTNECGYCEMATTGTSMGVRLLDALHELPGRVALLHGEAAIAAGEIPSDLDLVVDSQPDALAQALLSNTGDTEDRLILRWPYDRQSVTYFFCNPTGTEGVQLDLVYDPKGRGRYGFRSTEMLDRSIAGARWMRLDPIDEFLYVLRKRQVKRDVTAVSRLLANKPDVRESLIQRGRVAFSSDAATNIEAMLSKDEYLDPRGAAFDRRMRNIVANPGYYLSRVAQQVGWWLALPDCNSNDVQRAVEPLERLLPRVTVTEASRVPLLAFANRKRAGLFLTVGPGSHTGADRVLRGTPEPDRLRSQIVSAMAEGLVERRQTR